MRKKYAPFLVAHARLASNQPFDPLVPGDSVSLTYFVSCTNARFTGCVGMALNDLPASSCC